MEAGRLAGGSSFHGSSLSPLHAPAMSISPFTHDARMEKKYCGCRLTSTECHEIINYCRCHPSVMAV